MAPPASVMGPLSSKEYDQLLQSSDLNRKYKESVDPQSAFETLKKRLKEKNEEQTPAQTKTSGRKEKSTFDQVLSSPVAKQVGRELIRVLFGKTPRATSRKRGGFF